MGQTLTDRTSLAAGASNDNLLANKQFAILPQDSKVTVAVTGSVDSGIVSISVGRELLFDGQEVPDTAASPRNPEDVLVTTFAQRGDQVIVKARNDNAAANVIRTTVWIEGI
jgi:hypothetical protein